MQLQISEDAYATLQHVAQWRNTMPEVLLENLVSEQLPGGFARDEQEFFHTLGFDDAEIAASTERIKLLSEIPDC